MKAMIKEDTSKGESLSKKERRKLRREQKKLKHQEEIKKARLRKWGFASGVGVLLVGGLFLFNYLNKGRYEEAPKIQVAPATHNFGKVLASEGTATTSFEVKNVGVSPLIISEMKTSCGCTTAVLVNNGQESPVLGMHSDPSDWSAEIEPGSSAELKVMFDPNFHQNTSGPVTRTVSIFSNDPGKGEEKVTINADVRRP